MAVRLWGNQFQVNGTTAKNQNDSSVVALANGGFVVVWRDDMGGADDRVYFQRYDALGQAQGGPTLVPSDGGSQDLPTITAYRDGGFIIGVRDNDAVNDNDTMGYRFTASGALAETIFVAGFIDTGPGGFSDGYIPGFYLEYYGAYRLGAAGNGDIFLSIRTPNNTNATNLKVNLVSDEGQRDPVVAFNPLLGYSFAAVAWIRDGALPNDESIDLRLYDRSTSAFLPEVELVTLGQESVSDLHLTWVSFNVVAVSYTAIAGLEREGFVKLYNTASDTFTSVQLGTIDRTPEPDVTALDDGRFAVAWRSRDGGENSIHLQLYNIDGSKSGAEIIINSDFTDDSRFPALATLADGRIVVTWTDLDGDGSGVFSQIIDPRDGIITGNDNAALAETLVGNAILNDEIRGLRGNDTLYGLAGVDALYGGMATTRRMAARAMTRSTAAVATTF